MYFFPKVERTTQNHFHCLFVSFFFSWKFFESKIYKYINSHGWAVTVISAGHFITKELLYIHVIFFSSSCYEIELRTLKFRMGSHSLFFHFFRPENGQEIGCGRRRRRRHSVRWLDQNRVREVERTGAAYNSPWGFFFLFFSFCGLLWPCCDVAVFCHRPAVEIAPHYIMKYIYTTPNTKISQRKEKKKWEICGLGLSRLVSQATIYPVALHIYIYISPGE